MAAGYITGGYSRNAKTSFDGFDQYTLGATTVDGAKEVLDYGSGANIITLWGTADYQTAITKVWNAAITN